MLILLDLGDAAVLERPPDHVRLAARALDVLRPLDGAPELGEIGQLDEMPHVRERRADDGALVHLVGGGDGLWTGSRHVCCRAVARYVSNGSTSRVVAMAAASD